MTPRRARMLRAMDADADGSITKGELDTFIEKLMKSADANADGGVSLDEARSFKVAKLKKTLNGEAAN